MNGSVEKFTPDGVGTVFADSVFDGAYGLAIDASGNVYVSNLRGNYVLWFTPDGTNLGVFASEPLRAPLGMFFDSSGNLYVANSNRSSIESFSPTGEYLGIFATTAQGPHFFALSTPTPAPHRLLPPRRARLKRRPQPRHLLQVRLRHQPRPQLRHPLPAADTDSYPHAEPE